MLAGLLRRDGSQLTNRPTANQALNRAAITPTIGTQDSGPDPMPDNPAPPPFSIPLYRRIWVANVASQFGSLIQSVGAAWLMVELGGTKTQIALVQASVTLPIMILALLSGAVADNYPRRLVMLVCQSWMFILCWWGPGLRGNPVEVRR